MTPAQMYALDARRHMHLYGTTSEQLGPVAVTCYTHAQRNPRAVMHGTAAHAGSAPGVADDRRSVPTL